MSLETLLTNISTNLEVTVSPWSEEKKNRGNLCLSHLTSKFWKMYSNQVGDMLDIAVWATGTVVVLQGFFIIQLQ